MFEKSTEKVSVYRKAFILKMAGAHSSLERSVMSCIPVSKQVKPASPVKPVMILS